MPVPVIIQIAAEKDSSVQRVTTEVSQAIKGLGDAKFDPFTGFSDSAKKALADIQQFKTQASTAGQLQVFTGQQVQAGQQVLAQLQQFKTANAEALSQNKELAAEFRNVEREAKAAAQAAIENQKQLGEFGKQASIGLIALGTGLAAVLAGSVTIAARYEQLQAKLVTFKGTVDEANKSFAFAQGLAAKTPFDVEGIVSATAILESFKQRSEIVLPRVANLAAGLSTDIKKTALDVSKALSGSAEGFESLRNEYGITTAELKKYGAAVNDQNELLIKGEVNTNRAREALLKIIDTRFGDATERQSKTFNGALSNLGDASKNLAANFGATLIPALSSGLQTVSGILDTINNKTSTGFKTIIAVTAAVSAGLLVLGGTAGVLVAGLVLLNANLAATNVQLTAAGVNGGLAATGLRLTSAALSGIGSGAGFAGSAITTMLGPLGLALVAVTALSAAVIQAEADFRALGQRIADESKQQAKNSTLFRDVVNEVNRLSKASGVKVDITSDFAKQAAQIQEAFAKLSPEQVVRSFAATGKSVNDFKNDLASAETQTKSIADKVNELEGVLRKLGEVKDPGNIPQVLYEMRDAITAIDPSIEKDASGVTNLEAIKTRVTQLRTEFAQLSNAKIAIGEVINAFDEFATPLEKVTESAKNLKDFLSYSQQIGSAKSMAAALKEVQTQIEKNQSVQGIGKRTPEQLVQQLATPGISNLEKDAIKAQLVLLKEKADIEKKQADESKRNDEARIRARELLFQREKALRDVSAAEELRFVQQQLAAAKQGTTEEVRLLEQAKNLKKTIRDQERDTASKSLADVVAAAKASAQETFSAPDATAAGNIQALQGVLDKLSDWKAANAQILQQVPSVRREYEAAVRAINTDKIKESAKIPAENFARLKQFIADFSSGAVTATDRLNAAERGTKLVQDAGRQGLIAQKDAENELIGLAKARAAAEQQVTNELAAQKAELLNLDTQNQDAEIAILEERKKAGEDVENALKRAREDRLRQALQSIELERQAAIDAGKDVEQADAVAQRKRTALEKAEVLKRIQQNATGGSQAGQPASANGNATGGGFSLPGFSLPTFSLDAPARAQVQNAQNAQASFRQTQATVQTEIARRKGEIPGDSTKASAGNAGNSTVIINIDAKRVEQADDKAFVDSIMKRQRIARAISGTNRNPIQQRLP